MRKAISEIIVVVILLMISVATVGVAYVFIMGFQGKTTGEVQQSNEQSLKKLGSCLQISSFDDASNNLWLKNCGRYPISNVTVFIDNAPAAAVALNANPNEIKNIPISASIGIHEIKLISDYASAIISVNVTKTGPACSDGTPYGQCSASKPLFCNSGVLINKCSVCGCSGSGICQADESCSFDFSLAASPSSGFASQGSIASTTVTATLQSGTTQGVLLACSGLPAGTSCSFGTNPVTPTASSSLTIQTSGTTPIGTYAINIGSKSGNLERNTTYTMTVTTDTVAPSAVTNLATGSPSISSITLTWTAPGDDGNIGTASQYDIRYSTSAITDLNWASATQVSGVPAPKTAGSVETFAVTGLSSGATYYFAIKTADEVPNWSAISNSPSGTTLTPKIVFVSSGTYNGKVGGLIGADSICQNLAAAVPSLAGKTFKAWLSDSTKAAKDRLTHATIPYVRIDGFIVANGWNDLVDGSLQNPINRDENGNTEPYQDYWVTWTGTSISGTGSGGFSPGIYCNDWASGTNTYTGNVGFPGETGSSWTEGGNAACDSSSKRLYCLEQ